MERKITAEELLTEELLTDDQWDALGLSDDDVLITFTHTEDSDYMKNAAQIKQDLYEKDGNFYQKERLDRFDGTTETVYYLLSEEDALTNISVFLKDYEMYDSQFSCDRNAHFSVKVEITAELMQFVNEDDKSIINRYFPEHTNNKNNTIER